MAELTTGLVTYPDLDGTPANFRVTWIGWDSPFRGTELAVGDRIVAVNGTEFEKPVEPQDPSYSIGQYLEYETWEKAGLAAGAPITIRVRRRNPPSGWQELEMQAGLIERPDYSSAEGRRILGPGGPDAMANDEFDGPWGYWYDETLIRALSRALDVDVQSGTYVTRFEYESLQAHQDRVAYVTKHYGGPFASVLARDFETALVATAGRPVTLPPGALDFRRRGEELAGEIRVTAEAGWSAFKEKVSATTIPPFPAVHPVRGDLSSVVGKHVVLPVLGNSEWISEAGRGWFAAGNETDGWYFLDAEAEPALAMLLARERFARIVDPNVEARFEFVGQILEESRLVVVGERAQFGLQAEPVGALVGGSMFVDLTARKGSQVAFAGEEGLVDATPDVPPPAAPPDVVLGALVGAVKAGDIALWLALQVDWRVERRDDGSTVVYPHQDPPSDDGFERSRRSMLGRVLDAQVAWVDDPVTVTDGTRFPGALRIEEVTVWLDHIGTFDGESRTFADVTVSRRWQLERVDGGPWRVATVQDI